MNITPQLPTISIFNPASVNTESARRDSVQRETIPQVSQNERSAAESGVGSESERARTAAQGPQPIVYERPQIQQQQSDSSQQTQGDNTSSQDNAEDPSAGREDAENRQQQQQERAEQSEIRELRSRDQEVRAHEQAHAAVGGQYAGSPQYEFETGPDGRQYAVGGEVSIDVSPEANPEDTIRKAQQVKASALAPAEPSPQDLRVASEATRLASEARNEIARERAEEAQEAVERVIEAQQEGEPVQLAEINSPELPELDDITQGISTAGIPTRTLAEVFDTPQEQQSTLQTSADEFQQARGARSAEIQQRISVIEGFYAQVSQPQSQGFQQSA